MLLPLIHPASDYNQQKPEAVQGPSPSFPAGYHPLHLSVRTLVLASLSRSIRFLDITTISIKAWVSLDPQR
jgi:hypothetical protein